MSAREWISSDARPAHGQVLYEDVVVSICPPKLRGLGHGWRFWVSHGQRATMTASTWAIGLDRSFVERSGHPQPVPCMGFARKGRARRRSCTRNGRPYG